MSTEKPRCECKIEVCMIDATECGGSWHTTIRVYPAGERLVHFKRCFNCKESEFQDEKLLHASDMCREQQHQIAALTAERDGLRREVERLEQLSAERRQTIEHDAEIIASHKQLEEKLRCVMGVGDGAGQRFVYGDYESIKAAQSIVIERSDFALKCADLQQRLKDAEAREEELLDSISRLNAVDVPQELVDLRIERDSLSSENRKYVEELKWIATVNESFDLKKVPPNVVIGLVYELRGKAKSALSGG